MKKFKQFIKGLEESLAYLEAPDSKSDKLPASAAALDRALRQIEADLVEEDKFFSPAKGHKRVVILSEPPKEIEKDTLYLTVIKDKIIAQSHHIKPPRNLSNDEASKLRKIIIEKEEDKNCKLSQAFIKELDLIEKLVSICDYTPAQRIGNFKNGLKKILAFIIKNKEHYSKIPRGKVQRIEKSVSKCGYTFFILHNENGDMELHINEKSKLSKYRREGTSKVVKKTFVFQNNEWERHAGLIIKKAFYYKNIYFQKGELSQDQEKIIIKNRDVAILDKEDGFHIGFVDKKNRYVELLLEESEHIDLIDELKYVVQNKIMTSKKVINSALVRSKIFSIIENYENHHPGYDNNPHKIVSKSGNDLGIEKEIRAGKKIKSPHVAAVKLLCLYEDKKTRNLKLALDSKLADYDLHDLSKKHLDQVKFIDVYSIIYTAFKGLADTHAAGVIHQDINTKNILIKKDEDGHFRALIADFGLAITEIEKNENIGSATPGYAAPEFWKALLDEGPNNRRNSPIRNLFDHYKPFHKLQDEANVALRKFKKSRISVIPDIKPNQSNDVWALALAMKDFLTNFKTRDNYYSLDDLSKKNIELLIESMNKILYSPRETRMSAADFLDKELPRIIITLEKEKADEINKRLNVLGAMKYSGGGTVEVKPVPPRAIPTVTTPRPLLVPEQNKSSASAQDNKTVSPTPITQAKVHEDAKKLSTAKNFEGGLQESITQLEEYKKLISQEMKGEDGRDKRNYDSRFAFFNSGCDKRQKLEKVTLLIQTLQEKNYSRARNLIAANSTVFGVFGNGRLSGHINQLKNVLDSEPNYKPDSSSRILGIR